MIDELCCSLNVWCVVCLLQRAVIALVSPDVLYLFRVQAVCQRDQRSDFSQTLLFKGLSDFMWLSDQLLLLTNP